MSLVVETRQILLEDLPAPRVIQGCSGSKWMCSEPDLSQRVLTIPSAIGNINFSPFLGVNTSFALTLLAWISDASILSNSLNVCDQNVSLRDSSRV